MKSERYFQEPHLTRRALGRYAELTREWGWPIGESKLALYRHAAVAFGGRADEATRRVSHGVVDEHLRGYWQVGRRGTLWTAARIFDVLSDACGACARGSGVSLPTVAGEPGQRAVLGCLERLPGLKALASGRYPVMAVSKNLHFFHPGLFPIYDTAVVVKKVYRAFRADWTAAYREIAVGSGDGWIDFYLAYLLWASRLVRTSHPGFMDDFADWFVAAVREEGMEADDFRGQLRTYYAAAFEFVAIGAAHLEGAACRAASR